MPAKKKSARRSSRSHSQNRPDHDLRRQLALLLRGGQAHVNFSDAIAGFPAKKRGVLVRGLAHTAWQLLEHARLAQRDILEYCRNPQYVAADFPDGYWPKTPIPPNPTAWDNTAREFHYDLLQMIALVENPKTDLHAPIPHGSHGHNILREALVLADHNAYHLGQLVDLRRALGIWPEA
jgi:DinB family protein